MSRVQGDSYKTETNIELNNYYYNVFLPKLTKMENEQEKIYYINGGKIICKQFNIVEYKGYKLNTIKITGVEYIINVYSDDKGSVDIVKSFNNKDEANEFFKYWKQQLEI